MPISNSYQAYNADAARTPTRRARSPTGPTRSSTPRARRTPATTPTRAWSTRRFRRPPRRTPVAPDTVTPAPWVPYTRAGCDVGEVATANQELENTAVDIPKVFGAGSPEDQQLNADTGLVQGRRGRGLRRRRRALRPGQRVLRRRQGREVRPDRPVGDRGVRPAAGRAGRVQRVPGAVRPPVRRAAARRGHAEPDPATAFQVTNAAGNLVDENGNQINGAFLTNHPGLPRVRPDQRVAEPGLHGGHAGVRRPGGERLHRRHPRQREHPRRWPRARARRPRSARAPRATSPRRSTTTPRSARSSSGWPRTASPRPTRCSSSARTRATTWPAPTSAGPSSRPRPTATA